MKKRRVLDRVDTCVCVCVGGFGGGGVKIRNREEYVAVIDYIRKLVVFSFF